LWKTRNALVFEEVAPSVKVCTNKIFAYLEETNSESILTPAHTLKCNMMNVDIIKVGDFDTITFCDGAFGGSRATAPSASAALSFNKSGVFISGKAEKGSANSVILAELEAIKMGCSLISSTPGRINFICSDSASAIAAISADWDPPWEVAFIISDIKWMIKDIDCRFFYIPRIRNKMADSIVSDCIQDCLPLNWNLACSNYVCNRFREELSVFGW
jgi:ribonuclease HI